MPSTRPTPTSEELLEDLRLTIDRGVAEAGGSTEPVKPGPRTAFRWPPHPISQDYHVLGSEWTGSSSFEAYGHRFEVELARTPHGIFGRTVALWNEAKGDSEQEVLQLLLQGAEPYLAKAKAIAEALGEKGLFLGHLRDLPWSHWLRLLYCPNKDVGHEALVCIEGHASSGVFGMALVEILRDVRHPYRRLAQWFALDLCEDLPSVCRSEECQSQTISAIESLIWEAPDDYGRTIYKAGVVLGGHICTDQAADALIRCIAAPSKIGRRSAQHAVFHLAEWMPERKEQIVDALRLASTSDPDPLLCHFAERMASDIERGEPDHMTEPLFPEELA